MERGDHVYYFESCFSSSSGRGLSGVSHVVLPVRLVCEEMIIP